MSEHFHFRTLKPLDLTDMYLAFLNAFSDYPVGFKLTKEQFVRKFVEKLKIDFSLSIGAFDLDALAGFIFTSVNYYEGKLTSYNGGTGVRTAYRGNRLTSQMYDYLIPLLEQKKVKQCVLEVLTENSKAIKAYESVGFEKTKVFKCFKLTHKKLAKRPVKLPIKIFPVTQPDWHTYEKFSTYKPSFLDTPLMISENLPNEQIVEVHHDERCIGYGIYQPAFGRIGQIGVHEDFRQQGIGSALTQHILKNSRQKALTVINVNEEAQETVDFFINIGFENQIDQYEMILPLQ